MQVFTVPFSAGLNLNIMACLFGILKQISYNIESEFLDQNGWLQYSLGWLQLSLRLSFFL